WPRPGRRGPSPPSTPRRCCAARTSRPRPVSTASSWTSSGSRPGPPDARRGPHPTSRGERRMPPALWTYLPAAPGGPLDVDRAFYGRLARETARRTPVDAFVIPIRSGRAWPVRAGQLCRIVVIEGPQVADFNCWNLHNPRERFWASRTKQLHRAHVTTFDRLWSTLPYLRPMLTITNDTVAYGTDADGGRCHDLLGTRCDPYVNKLLTGQEFDLHCHSNLTRAVLPWGLGEADVHDVLNVFQ